MTAIHLAAALAVVAVPAALPAQVPLDRIVAVVGDHPILASEVEERLLVSAQQGQIPADSAARAALRGRILQQMINEELEVQQALRGTSIKVTDQEVQDQVESQVKSVKAQIPDPNEFLRQLHIAGFTTVEEWRRKVAEDQRRQILVSRLLENLRQNDKLRPIPPNDAQMRAFWDLHKNEVGKRPANISYRQIVILPQPDSAARAAALHLADSLYEALRARGSAAADPRVASAREPAPERQAAPHSPERRADARLLGPAQERGREAAGEHLLPADRDSAAARFGRAGGGPASRRLPV